MLTLGLDTSAVTASVGLARDGEVLCEFSLTGGLTHSEHLVPMIENCLDYAQLSLKDMDCFAVSVGPGSFTGLRIGVATVKGLAFADQKPCVPISTLEALASAFTEEDAVFCPVMDARRGEFYNALFRYGSQGLVRLCKDRAISGKELEEELKGFSKVIVNGDGAVKFLSGISSSHIQSAHSALIRQSGARVALLGQVKMQKGKGISPNDLSPTYLRLPQAERELLAKTNH